MATISYGLPLGHEVVRVCMWWWWRGGRGRCVTTYKWESEVTSLKMPSGSSEISLPWRDLRGEGWRGRQKKRSYDHKHVSVGKILHFWTTIFKKLIIRGLTEHPFFKKFVRIRCEVFPVFTALCDRIWNLFGS